MRTHYAGIGTLTLAAAVLTACSEEVLSPAAGTPPAAAPSLAVTSTSNGFPSGAHYSLNVIGVPKGKTASMTGGSGHRIFVNLDGNTKINLVNADLSDGAFRVLDANGTDGNGATFQLPSPDPENDGITTYSVYARALGKPGGSSTTTSCFDDAQTLERYCSVNSMLLVREKGKSTGENVSRDLLYVYYDVDRVDSDGDGQLELVRAPLFSDALDSYFWSYDNSGLKLAQFRFYQIATNVN